MVWLGEERNEASESSSSKSASIVVEVNTEDTPGDKVLRSESYDPLPLIPPRKNPPPPLAELSAWSVLAVFLSSSLNSLSCASLSAVHSETNLRYPDANVSSLAVSSPSPTHSCAVVVEGLEESDERLDKNA